MSDTLGNMTLADLLNELRRGGIGAGFSGGRSSGTAQGSAIGDDAEHKKLVKSIKDAASGLDKWRAALKHGSTMTIDVSKQLEELDDQIKAATDSGKQQQLQNRKDEILKAAANNRTIAGAMSLTSGLIQTTKATINFAKSAGSAGATLAKSFLDGSSGVSMASGMLTAGLDLAGQAGATAGNLMDRGGAVLAQSNNKTARRFGMVAEAAGALTVAMSETASKFLKFGVEVLTKEVEKTVEAFNTISAAGGMFAHGIEDMYKYAGMSGLTLKQFSNVVKTNAGLLAESGYTVTDGAKIMAGVTGNLATNIGKSGLTLRHELQNLGYSFEEQAGLSAEIISNLKKTGGQATNGQVAQATVEMGKNMRIVADIMGQDAKAKMDQAKKQSEQYAFNAKLRELAKKNNDPGLIARVQSSLSLMDDVQQRAVIQATVLGGAVTDVAANVLGMGDAARQSAQRILDGSQSIEEIAGPMARANDKFAQGTDATANAISIANIAVGSLGDLATAANSLGQQAFKLSSENLAKASEAVDKTTAINSGMQRDIVAIENNMQAAQIEIQQMMVGAMGSMTAVLNEMIKTLKDAIDEALGKKPQGNEKLGWIAQHKKELMFGAGAALEGLAVLGTVVSLGALAPFTTAIGAGGAALMNGSALVEDEKGPGKADGGIASGPKDGYIEKLHGNELVLPLTSSGTIKTGTQGYADLLASMQTTQQAISPGPQPINQVTNNQSTANLDELTRALQDLISAAQDQLNKQDQLISVMSDNKDVTERLYHAMS